MTHTMHQLVQTLEAACEDESLLISLHLPDVQELILRMNTLPASERTSLQDRLDRIVMLLEGQMMLMGEQIDLLKKQIISTQKNSAASNAYERTVAVIPISPEQLERARQRKEHEENDKNFSSPANDV